MAGYSRLGGLKGFGGLQQNAGAILTACAFTASVSHQLKGITRWWFGSVLRTGVILAPLKQFNG